ncbi:MAG: fibronectin type III domain-containing protein [Vicingaceae bacterium]|nr:fibronectin type III domain-containing protein [Vicingaceae bacterium]
MKKIYSLLIVSFLFAFNYLNAGNYHDSIPEQCSNTTGGTLILSHTNAQSGATSNGTLKVDFFGDLDLSTEYVDVLSENGTLLATLSTASQCGQEQQIISLDKDSINSWALDGNISFTYQSSSAVNSGICTGLSGPAAFCVVPVISYTYQQGVDNIGVLSLDAPSPGTCAGNTPITITVGNFGTNQVDTFSVAWEINGVAQTPQTYYTLLDTNGGTNPTTTQITLNPSYNFTASTTFKFWTYSPNNVLDTINQNDTLQSALSPALAGIYTIGSGGNYINFTAAVNDLVALGVCAPVTFNVLTGSGPFNEQIEISQVVGASSTNTITFNGNGETITYLTTGTTDNYIIRLNGADYITIDSLNLVAQSSINNFVIQLTNDADFNTINNCNIDLSSTLSSTSSSNAGIVVSGSLTSATTAGASGTNNTFTNNTIIGGYYGLTINGASSTSESLNNTISSNTIQDFYLYGTYLRSISNSVISNNDIHRMNRSSVSTFYGLYFVTSGGRNLIEANQVHDAYTGVITANSSTSYVIYHSGVDVAIGDENRVLNNLIYNINNNGSIYAIYNSSSDGVHYFYNTISLDDANATGGLTRGFYQITTASNIEFKNNIITVTRGGTGTKHCIYYGTAGSTIISNNNVFYMNAPTGTNNLGYSGSDQATLLDWQTATSGDANSVDDDPIFANPASAQFSPANAAIDGVADASVNVTTDIYGVTRAVTPDPGAIEFTPPTCPQPSNLVVTNITGTTVDLSWTENGTATIWDIEWDTAGFTPTGIPTITGTTTNPHPLTGLTPLTDYEFYVRAYCSASDTSLWSGPYTFTTGCATQLSGIYTIGTTGNYLTFTDAINDMTTCGISGPVVFNVLTGSGPFNEQITIPSIMGSSGVNTITFNGNGEIITSTTTSSSRSIILLDGADHIIFDSLIVQTQSSTNNFAIQLINDADSNTINNCVVDLTSTLTSTSTTNAGIVVSGSLTGATTAGASGAYNTITNNHIIGGYYGITINGASSTNESHGNTINDNRIEDVYSYSTYLRSVSNSTISFNEISRPNRTSVTTFYGLYFITSGERNTVEGNRLHDPFRGLGGVSTSTSYPIYHSGVDATVGNENRVINNLIYNINSNGTIYAFYNSGSGGVHYYHNTISLDDQNATGGTTRGFYQTLTASNIEFKNNIVTVTRLGTGTKYCVYHGTSTSTITSDNNVLYMNAPAGTNNLGYAGGAQATLVDWQTATSGDANSVDVNPLYVNLTANNYAPSNPLVDAIADASVNVTTDIFGITRAVTPDPGAIEFTPPNCSQPVNLATINVTSTTANLSWLETGSAITWQIDWDTVGVAQGFGNLVVTTNNPHTITGLLPQSEYRYYVRSICAVGDTSLWSNPYTLTTLCAPTTAPWLDDVETHATTTNSTIENCWSSSPASTTASFRWNVDGVGSTPTTSTGPSGAYSGNNYFYVESSSGSTGDEAFLSLPLIDASALTTPMLEFYYHMYGSSTGDLYVEMFDGTNWTKIDSIKGEQQTSDTDPWLKQQVILSGAVSDTLQLRFVAVKGSGGLGDISIDDVSVLETPSCLEPKFLGVSNLLPTQTDFVWTEVGSATTWQLEWALSGFTLGNGVRLNTTTNPYTQLGLAPQTAYDFYVRSICGVGDTSLWVGPFRFTTPCTAVNAPWFDDVETHATTTNAIIENCWTTNPSNTTTLYAWNIDGSGSTPSSSTGPSSAYSGNNYFYIEASDGSQGDVAELYSPLIDVSSLNTPELEFYYHMYGSTMGDLYIDINNGTNWITVDSILGEQQTSATDPWLKRNVILLGFTNTVQVRFRSIKTGTSFYGDMSLDDIRIQEATVCSPQIVNLGNDTTICGTDSILLNAGANHINYLWSDAAETTSPTLIVDSTTFGIGVHTIFVEVVDSTNSCVSRDTIVVEITTCVGIEDFASTIDLNVYPNPNKGQFTLNLTTKNTSDLQIRITNIQGQEVFVKNNFDNINVINEEINIGNVKGVYFVNIMTNNEVITKKIIVQ